MKSTHFSNRDSLKDAMKHMGVKHSDIDMSNKRSPVCMDVSEVIEKPMHFKKGGMASMPADKLHRLVKPCRKMPCAKTPHFNQGGMMNENKDDMTGYKKGGMCRPMKKSKKDM